jgi:hypothetical protein
VFVFGGIAHYFLVDTPTGFDNQARYRAKGVQEALKYHPNDCQTQGPAR